MADRKQVLKQTVKHLLGNLVTKCFGSCQANAKQKSSRGSGKVKPSVVQERCKLLSPVEINIFALTVL